MSCMNSIGFNTQPPEGGWLRRKDGALPDRVFQHTAARRRLEQLHILLCQQYNVSTHSRPKAAGPSSGRPTVSIVSFNTQPPEGGWYHRPNRHDSGPVSTHSRPKAAGCIYFCGHDLLPSFNTQPPEGGWSDTLVGIMKLPLVSTHSRPKAAGAD